MKLISESINTLSKAVNFLGGVFLIAMILITCANIVSRIIWVPIPGTFELLGFFGALTTAFALGYTQLMRGHIAVDILTRNYPGITKKAVRIINNILFFVVFAVAGKELWLKALTLMRSGEITETLRMSYHPFVFGVSVGCGLLALVFMADLLAALIPVKESYK
jgi:TRAP-type C4-dicarboxylate transport system permease small subunit